MPETACCCRQLPDGALDGPCTWPETDCYENGPAELAVNPRWRDYKTMPDRWVYDRAHRWLRKHPRLIKTHPSKAFHRWAGRRFWCSRSGECIFRNGHRGGCYWGDEGE